MFAASGFSRLKRSRCLFQLQVLKLLFRLKNEGSFQILVFPILLSDILATLNGGLKITSIVKIILDKARATKVQGHLNSLIVQLRPVRKFVPI